MVQMRSILTSVYTVVCHVPKYTNMLLEGRVVEVETF